MKGKQSTEMIRIVILMILTINARVLSSITCLIREGPPSFLFCHQVLIFHAVDTSLSQILTTTTLFFFFFGCCCSLFSVDNTKKENLRSLSLGFSLGVCYLSFPCFLFFVWVDYYYYYYYFIFFLGQGKHLTYY